MSEEAIVGVLNLYSAALDSHSWDLFDEIFDREVEADYPGGLHWYDLESFKRDFAYMHEQTAGHQHFLGVPQVLVDGDRAFCLTYGRFNLFRRSPAVGASDMSEGGAWYDDELARTGAGWRVLRRVARNFWWRGTIPEEGDAPRVVESFPEWVRTGRVAYMNALRARLRQATPAPAGSAGP